MAGSPLGKPVFRAQWWRASNPRVENLATKREKKMYKPATPGSDTHHKQIALLLRT
jgi:hypothetical protein